MVGGKTYVVDLRSQQFFTVLRLEDRTGKTLARNDPKEDPKGHTARLICTPQRTETYRCVVTSLARWRRGNDTLQGREFMGAAGR